MWITLLFSTSNTVKRRSGGRKGTATWHPFKYIFKYRKTHSKIDVHRAAIMIEWKQPLVVQFTRSYIFLSTFHIIAKRFFDWVVIAVICWQPGESTEMILKIECEERDMVLDIWNASIFIAQQRNGPFQMETHVTWMSAKRSLRMSSLLSTIGFSSSAHTLLQTNQAPSSILLAITFCTSVGLPSLFGDSRFDDFWWDSLQFFSCGSLVEYA